MKKLILALIIGASISVCAQTSGKVVGAGTIWTDSLGYTNLDETKDSVWILDTKFSKSWYRIFIEGNDASPVDSFYIQLGSRRYAGKYGAEVDIVWGSWALVKDSVWGDINTMVNNTVGKDFLLFSPIAQLIKFTLLNNRGDDVTRTVVITVQAIKD